MKITVRILPSSDTGIAGIIYFLFLPKAYFFDLQLMLGKFLGSKEAKFVVMARYSATFLFVLIDLI
jgi:hypothetical protein